MGFEFLRKLSVHSLVPRVLASSLDILARFWRYESKGALESPARASLVVFIPISVMGHQPVHDALHDVITTAEAPKNPENARRGECHEGLKMVHLGQRELDNCQGHLQRFVTLLRSRTKETLTMLVDANGGGVLECRDL